MEELDSLFGRGVRYLLRRHLQRSDVEDEVCDTFAMVIRSIRKGEVLEAHRLSSHVLTLARLRMAVSRTGRETLDRSRVGAVPPRDGGSTKAARHLLASLAPNDREILERFYVKAQPPDQICAELSITSAELQLLKSSAKSTFSGLMGALRGEQDREREAQEGLGHDGIVEALRRAAEAG